ncbi:MBL fold metallo-hydrolase RNA specificity domain-containing protein [Marinomonas ostreistagni]|uniref:MBL fold metallo-hydrolase RNA specificity domain-containing protein n=1 Tax=Marinomonas ostreistagni TaxID=359209 RepID=UPI00194FFB9A|nr:MBL fold metallo-hydrolase [Marinomonas ostreistagni]MBM6551038.1 MBL fold metallo-hydrolase [Marinomonas ostreistagni]
MFEITHHGAKDGVTGSCHELIIDDDRSLLVDCGLFQGSEASERGASVEQLAIEFDISRVQALIVTHVHIDHVGRIPYLLAAGFSGPIICSKPSAELLPLVIEDALKVGVTRNRDIIEACLERLRAQLVAVEYEVWHALTLNGDDAPAVQVRLSPAGHILGSAYVSVRLPVPSGETSVDQHWHVVFSGDLGAPHAPLLPEPKAPERADQLVLESTYGDKDHEDRSQRRERLQASMAGALADGGVVLIPAFSIGRTQELLYEIESIIHEQRDTPVSHTRSGASVAWDELDIIVDSPLANDFTEVYRRLKPYWDQEASERVASGRHPLNFEQITTIDEHDLHVQTVDYLARQARPAVVIAASGMCAGGRIVNYLKALLGDARNDVIFVGYQAAGTPGRDLLRFHHKANGYVEFDGERYPIKAKVWQLGGYSAHAGQADLLRFVAGIPMAPRQVKLVHGEADAKQALALALQERCPEIGAVVRWCGRESLSIC